MTKANRIPLVDRDLLRHLEDYLVRRVGEVIRSEQLGEAALQPEEIDDMLPAAPFAARMPKLVLDSTVNMFDGIDEVDYEVRAEIADSISCVRSKACMDEEWDTDYGTFLLNRSLIH
uniref:Uncharacterized protein n=1 Tax=Agrobacterium albertimagni TaxID=147266 RepID=A0A7C1NWY1_9HYPH